MALKRGLFEPLKSFIYPKHSFFTKNLKKQSELSFGKTMTIQ